MKIRNQKKEVTCIFEIATWNKMMHGFQTTEKSFQDINYMKEENLYETFLQI